MLFVFGKIFRIKRKKAKALQLRKVSNGRFSYIYFIRTGLTRTKIFVNSALTSK